jgi:hypothetical protein
MNDLHPALQVTNRTTTTMNFGGSVSHAVVVVGASVMLVLDALQRQYDSVGGETLTVVSSNAQLIVLAAELYE